MNILTDEQAKQMAIEAAQHVINAVLTNPYRELTYKQVKEQFNVGQKTLLEWESKGWIAASRVNGVRWSSLDVQRVIEQHRPKVKFYDKKR